MKNKNTYTGSKVQNHFTAYLLQFVHGKRRDYLEKKIRTADTEEPTEDIGEMKTPMFFDDVLEKTERERLLIGEKEGKFPEWNQLSDKRLVEAILLLREDERRLIYQHVFEERSFEEMSRLNGLSEDRCKGVYYYAIRKIRKMMGGKKNGF